MTRHLLALVVGLCLLGARSGAAVLYSQNFDGIASGTALSDDPPNFVLSPTYSNADVFTPGGIWSGNVARMTNSGGWFGWAYNGATFSDAHVRFRGGSTSGSRTNMLIRFAGTWNALGFPNSGYTIQVESPTSLNVDEWPSGPRHINTTLSPSVNLFDMTIEVRSAGTTHDIYIDGIYRATFADATYTSGRIGFVGFVGSNYVDNIVVTDGAEDDVSGKRGLRLRNYLRKRLGLLPELLLPSKLLGAPHDQVKTGQRTSFTNQRIVVKAMQTAVAKDMLEGRITPTATRTPKAVAGASTPTPTLTPTPTPGGKFFGEGAERGMEK